MARYLFDLETNGLLDTVDRIHCNVVTDLDTGVRTSFRPGEVERSLDWLAEADEIVGHNIMGYDNLVIEKLYPRWKPKGKVTDTLVMSRLVYADLKDRDFKFRKRNPEFPGHLIGRHSLEAWGHRFGKHKGDYAKTMKAKGLDPWAEFNEEMLTYCEDDVDLNLFLYQRMMEKEPSQVAIDLEHRVWAICLRQMEFGVCFDEQAAAELYATLAEERARIERQLADIFQPWFSRDGKTFVPKRSNKRTGYVEGCPLTKIKLNEFNPGSRDHIADRLMKLRGWKPRAFTDGGKPKVDEEVLSTLKYPEAQTLARYFMLEKRIGQIAEGNQAWLKMSRNGRIHGRINTNGAVTGRATHSHPNLGQVPAVRAEFGHECRSCFTATPGWSFVGADASGLELRMLAHYMSKWDNGDYGREVLEGDIHTANQRAAGLPTRDHAKTFIYAFLYGAGNGKIGSIVGKGAGVGGKLRKRFLDGLPALGSLVAAVQKQAKRGYLKSFDGRRIPVRHAHAALNTLLQGAGGVVMKQAMVNFHDILRFRYRLIHGEHYRQVLWVHDEFQVECVPEYAEVVGQAMVDGIRKVTQDFNLRIPLDGEYKIGTNWSETH